MLRTNSYYATYRGASGFVVKHIQPMPTTPNSKPFRAIVFRQGTDVPLAHISSLFSPVSPIYVVRHISGRCTTVDSFIAALLVATANTTK